MISDSFPLVSIIVANYNGKHFLGECFTSSEGLDFGELDLGERL